MGCGGSRHGALETARTAPATAAGAPRKTISNLKDQKDVADPTDQVQAKLPTVTLDGNLLPDSVRAAALRELNKRPGQSAWILGGNDENNDFGDDDQFPLLDEEYGHVITESSPPEKVRQVEEDFNSRARLLFVVELVVQGHGVPRLMSPKEKERAEQDEILETLRREGLVPKPPSKVNNGIKFEIVSSSAPFQQLALPLNRPGTAAPKKQLTLNEIQEKLERAEERRKQEEDRKRTVAKVPIPEVAKVQQEQEAMLQAKIEQRHKNKMDARAKIREDHLKELQRKLRVHQDHAEKVRQRKKLVVPSLSQED